MEPRGRSLAGSFPERFAPEPQRDAVSGTEVVGPGKVPVTLTLNGKALELSVEPRVTLLDAMRDRLDLTGAKKVCDRATCGSCTVLLDGRPAYACSVLAIEAQGIDITTIEGLGTPDDMHPIQAAFVANDAQQCGYCTPGFVVACKAFLDANPNPSLARRSSAGWAATSVVVAPTTASSRCC